MQYFSHLLDNLYEEQNIKRRITLFADYLDQANIEDRGTALSLLTGTARLPKIKSAALLEILKCRTDPVLLEHSSNFVSDVTEAIALSWPGSGDLQISLTEIVDRFVNSSADRLALVTKWLDDLPHNQRWCLTKLVTGAMHHKVLGIDPDSARMALAMLSNVSSQALAQAWCASEPPYRELFQWLDNQAPKPKSEFSENLPAHPVISVDAPDNAFQPFTLSLAGPLVMVCSMGNELRIVTLNGDDLTTLASDLLPNFRFEGVMIGSLAIIQNGKALSHNDLTRRLSRPKPTKKILDELPLHFIALDYLHDGTTNLKSFPLHLRLGNLELQIAKLDHPRFHFGPGIAALVFDRKGLRGHPLKSITTGIWWRDQTRLYQHETHWFHQPFPPMQSHFILLYVEDKTDGTGKLCTIGVFPHEGTTPVPIGRCLVSANNPDSAAIAKYVKENLVQKFGPVREITHTRERGLIIEVSYSGASASRRHKARLQLNDVGFVGLGLMTTPADLPELEELQTELIDM
ncbi:MAG: hypothetical protein JKY49_01100 [Cohaesibacteraceae bacterium]|nr:hypothetical protein [Cohaesibacteraceae bacterium]